jgi:hypothetical protein
MPALLAALGPLLITLLRVWMVSIIGRVLLTIGVGLFAYNVGVPELMGWVGAQFIALPPFVRESVAASGIDKFATMVLSALAVATVAKVFFGKASS